MSLKSLSNKHRLRKRRAWRVRKKVRGTALCPRLCVIKSNANLFVQLIDDVEGKTLVSASTISRGLKAELKGNTVESAKALGKHVAEQAKEMKIEKVVFDRGPAKFHGKLAALAEGVRETGLHV